MIHIKKRKEVLKQRICLLYKKGQRKWDEPEILEIEYKSLEGYGFLDKQKKMVKKNYVQ